MDRRNDLVLRPVMIADAQAIADGVIAEELAELGESDTTVDDVLELWTDEKTDLTNDARVLATLAGDIVGYIGFSRRKEGFMLDPHLHLRAHYSGRGLEVRLLRFAEQRARERLQGEAGLPPVLWSYSFTPARTNLLERAGYTRISSEERLQIILREAPPQPPLLSGIVVRPALPQRDEPAIYNVIQASFPDFMGVPYRPFEEWQKDVLERQAFDPSLLYVALDGATIIAAVLCRTYPEMQQSYIHQIAVLRPYRRRSIALHLLLTVFGECFRRGITDITLDMTSNNATGAHQLYRRVGMQRIAHVQRMEKVL